MEGMPTAMPVLLILCHGGDANSNACVVNSVSWRGCQQQCLCGFGCAELKLLLPPCREVMQTATPVLLGLCWAVSWDWRRFQTHGKQD